MDKKLIIGVDAANIRLGGGVTHLIELFAHVNLSKHQVAKVVIWGEEKILDQLPNFNWLVKIKPSILNKGFLYRIFWQAFVLSKAARSMRCDVLLVPGGTFVGNFNPVVLLSQSLLPFDWSEIRRYGLSLMAIKLILLRLLQSYSFKRANGLIFLTEYAENIVSREVNRICSLKAVIYHGLTERFKSEPKKQLSITNYDGSLPYRIIYVSTIDFYKHQWKVVEAIQFLRARGYPVVLDLVGSANSDAMKKLMSLLGRFDDHREWVICHGLAPYNDLHHLYQSADLAIIASSCEAFGIILLEAMSSGLPVACSNRSSLPEVANNAVMYFDPENSNDIARALMQLIDSPDLRLDYVRLSASRAKQFSWESCAFETFSFVVDVAKKKRSLL